MLWTGFVEGVRCALELGLERPSVGSSDRRRAGRYTVDVRLSPASGGRVSAMGLRSVIDRYWASGMDAVKREWGVAAENEG